MQYEPIPGVKVIGIGHKARNGKDTTANVLLDYFGSAARVFSFADDLYSVCRIHFGMKEKNPRLLQLVGTEIYREKDPDIWVNAVYEKIKDKQPRVAIIPDMRFPNEAAFVKAMGGIAVHCMRIVDGEQYIDPSRPADHPSEIALDDYDGWDCTFVASNTDVLEDYALRLAKQIGQEIGFQHRLRLACSV